MGDIVRIFVIFGIFVKFSEPAMLVRRSRLQQGAALGCPDWPDIGGENAGNQQVVEDNAAVFGLSAAGFARRLPN